MAILNNTTTVTFDVLPREAMGGFFGGSCRITVSIEEARRLVSELLEVTTDAFLAKEPRFQGIKLSDEGWDKLEANIRAAKRKKQTKKKKSKPKQEPVVAPKRKK